MNALQFAWRSLVRQPARALLGVLGVAAVGALLLDMLLLSEGLVLSMRNLLDRTGWDLRVTSGEDPLGRAERIRHAAQAVRDISGIPSVRTAIAVRFAEATVSLPRGEDKLIALLGVSEAARLPWTLLRGHDPQQTDELVVNEGFASMMNVAPGDAVTLRASCQNGLEALPPVRFTVAGVASFPFDEAGDTTAAGTLGALRAACGSTTEDEADLLLVMSSGDSDATASAVRSRRPDLSALTNQQIVRRLQQTGFTYFQQISAVLTTVTLSFAILLITVLLTVSVNQRLAEIAALRALGFSRTRVVADVLCESALIVGIGGALSLPLGLVLANVLDSILKRMPGIPEALHFFVFQNSAVALQVGLLAGTALIAAAYPMFLVSRLPITATLRDEVVG